MGPTFDEDIFSIWKMRSALVKYMRKQENDKELRIALRIYEKRAKSHIVTPRQRRDSGVVCHKGLVHFNLEGVEENRGMDW